MLTRKISNAPIATRSKKDLVLLSSSPLVTSDSWVELVGGLRMVKVPPSLSSALKKNLRDSFVAIVTHLSLMETQVERWMRSALQVEVSTKRLRATMTWILPSSSADLVCLLKINPVLPDGPLRRIDHWTEVIGPYLQLVWVRMDEICLQAWSVEAFRTLGPCLGMVVEMDVQAVCRKCLGALHVLILRDDSIPLP